MNAQSAQARGPDHPSVPPDTARPDARRTGPLGGEIDLGEYLGLLLEAKWTVLGTALVVAFIGALVAIATTPVYRADALLQVEEQTSTLGALDDVAALFQIDVPVIAELEIIRSRMVLGTAVRNLGLDIEARPSYFPLVGHAVARLFAPEGGGVAEPWFSLPRYAWGGEAIAVESFQVPRAHYGEVYRVVVLEDGGFVLHDADGREVLEGPVGERTREAGGEHEGVALFVSLLKARPGTEFELIRYSPLQAVANLADRFSADERGKQSGMLGISLEGEDPEQAARVLNEIANVYVRQNVERRSAEAERTLAFLEQQLPALKERLDAAEVAYNAYRLEHGSVDLAQETRSVLEQVVETEAELVDLQQSRDELRQKFTAAHPVVKALDAKIRRLSTTLGGLEDQVKVLPDTQQEVLRLARDVEVNTVLYTDLLNSSQELRIAKAGTVGNVRVVDHALRPDKPVKPKKVLILGGSFAGGLLLGAILVLTRRALGGGLEDPDEVERVTGLPVYAVIPHSSVQDKLARLAARGRKLLLVLALKDSEDPAVESLRSLRTTIHFAMLDAPNNIIHVPGPSPGVGKTFVAVNLGAVLALAGERVLVIDADLRRGNLHRYLGDERGGGLSEIVSGELETPEAIRETEVSGLHLMTTGKLPPNPAELLLHERFDRLLEQVSRHYDHVIVDSPPILAVTDAAIIGRRAGATLMVVRSGRHAPRELEQAVKRLQQTGLRLKGVVFNDVALLRGRYRSGYGKYVYQYSYKKTA
jgi:tyrosine-protein kinase Etk/Wzc